MAQLIPPTLTSLLQLAIALPVAFLVGKGTHQIRGLLVWWAAALFVVTSIATDLLAGVTLFSGQQWNWAGKSAALGVAVLFILASNNAELKQWVFNLKPRFEGARPILLVALTYLIVRAGLYLKGASNPSQFDGETTLFQATLPGMAEEFIFRGGILVALNAFIAYRPWRLAGVEFGWAAVITSVLFGLVHGLHFDGAYHLGFSPFGLVRAAFDGFLFALLAERTKSVLPSTIFHNLLNLIGNH